MNITVFEYTPAKISDFADPGTTLSEPTPANASFAVTTSEGSPPSPQSGGLPYYF
jgi:hypothetical protein